MSNSTDKFVPNTTYIHEEFPPITGKENSEEFWTKIEEWSIAEAKMYTHSFFAKTQKTTNTETGHP